MTVTATRPRALVINSFEDAPHIEDLELLPLEAGQVRVTMRTASVNAFDWKVAHGMLRHAFEYDFPVTIGRDFAGVVAEVGEGVTRVAVGDAVLGYLGGQALHRGTYATELICAEDECFVLKPAGLSFEQAACLPLCGIIASRCMDAVAPKDGELVLIVGAPGGVGSYAVQMAARLGAQVIATGEQEDDDYLFRLGAMDVVPQGDSFKDVVMERYPEGVDCMIDLVHRRDAFAPGLDLVRRGGRVASTHWSVDDDQIAGLGLSGANIHSGPDRDLLARLAQQAAAGELIAGIEHTFAFADLPKAVSTAKERHSRGRVVVRIAE